MKKIYNIIIYFKKSKVGYLLEYIKKTHILRNNSY